MRLLHLAPHYGGGIAPAAIGIYQCVEGEHTFANLRDTNDLSSIVAFRKTGLNLRSWREILSGDTLVDSFDFLVLHYWDTAIWNDLLSYRFMFSGPSILLNHQAFSYTGQQVLQFQKVFSFVIQSGFSSQNIPNNWLTVPTCKDSSAVRHHLGADLMSMTYVGTLSYKKVSVDFFPSARILANSGFTLDIYGNLNNDNFARDLEKSRNTSISNCGYGMDVRNLLKNYSYFFYPLHENHYGTTENALLEAMLEGLLPLVKSNNAEKSILGLELATKLNVDRFLKQASKGKLFSEDQVKTLSKELQQRAVALTKSSLRKEVWDFALRESASNPKTIDFVELSQRITKARKLTPIRSAP